MKQTAEERLVQIGSSILNASRNELYMNMRFLDVALSSLEYEADPSLDTVGTDGYRIRYNPYYLMDLYRKNRVFVNRAYLHMVLHCVFRHLMKRENREPTYWNLACDIAIESIIDSLYHRSIRIPKSYIRQEYYKRLNKSLKVLTAEGIYKNFMEDLLTERELRILQKEFTVDDHCFWPTPDQQNQPQMQMLNDKWKDISEKTQTNMETFARDAAQDAEVLLQQVQVENRERYQYRDFLRKFAVLREEVRVDPDTFDSIFYTYGLQLYGNMPLIEPQEFRESVKVEEFIIAIDTSMSCSGELVKIFLEETYSVLRETESFFQKVNIHIIQCDDAVRADKKITSEKELKAYMEEFELRGNGGTDFRPVFAHVDELLEQGAFRRLKGLIYFTDGCGTFPNRRPPYDTAFVFMQDEYDDTHVPPWAIKLILEPDDLTRPDDKKETSL